MRIKPGVGIVLEAGNGYARTEARVIVPWQELSQARIGVKWEALDTDGPLASQNESIYVEANRPYGNDLVCTSWGTDYQGKPWRVETWLTIEFWGV